MRALVLVCLFSSVWPSIALAEAPRPHIVYFLADDLGWQDVGFHGSEIKTPHLDQLAKTGQRLEQYYVQPVCSPTRSSLLTGRYPFRMGLQVGVIRPFAKYGLNLEERTLPAALKEVGYRTVITGKWHLGLHEKSYRPLARGFDHHYGHYCGNIEYFTHLRDGGLDWHRNEKPLIEEGYSTTLIGNEAARIIAEHDPAAPLFLYVPFNAPHTPLQAPQEYLDKYSHIKNPKRQKFAAMVDCLDEAVGRVVAALEKKAMRENTLIIFSSDNGGPVGQGADNGPLRAGKGTLYEGGVRVAALANWPGKLRPGINSEPLHAVDWHPTLLKLAGASLEQKLPLDGRDIWPTLTEGKPSPHEEIVHNVTPAGGALRAGDWKLVRTNNKAELFNIAKDPAEKQNLAEQHPEKVQELTKKLNQYRSEGVEPLGGSGPFPRDYKAPKVWGQP